MTVDEYKELITDIAAVYPSFKANDERLQKVWLMQMQPLIYKYARKAVDQYITEEKYPPTPTDIITRYKEYAAEDKSRLDELLGIFKLARMDYPVNLWTDDDEKAFLTKIKSDTFELAKRKALWILKAVENIDKTEITFAEFIRGVK